MINSNIGTNILIVLGVCSLFLPGLGLIGKLLVVGVVAVLSQIK